MAYEPKTWECGDVVTADALNHIEQGIAESGGGTVEVIKIATLNGGYTEGSNQIQQLGGGMVDGKSLAELLGEKKAVGFFTNLSSVMNKDCIDGTPVVSSTKEPLMSIQYNSEVAPLIRSCEMACVIQGAVSGSGGIQCDLYAICI